VGTKADKKSERQVSTEEGQELAHQQNIPSFMEVSAKDDEEQVKGLFLTIINMYLQSKKLGLWVKSMKSDHGREF